MGYIGFVNASTKIQLTSNCNTYETLKYGTMVKYPMSIAFVFVCAACFAAVFMVGFVLKTALTKYIVKEHLPDFIEYEEKSLFMLLYIFVSGILVRFWYIV